MLLLLIFAVFAPVFVFALFLSYHPALGRIANAATNPILILVVYTVVVALDFGSIVVTGRGLLGGHVVVASQTQLLWTATSYSAMLAAMMVGITLAFSVARQNMPAAPRSTITHELPRSFYLVVYGILLFAWAFTITQYSSDFFDLSTARYTKFAASGDSRLYILSALIVPALCFALYRQSLLVASGLFFATLSVVLFSGSRTRVLFAIIPYAFYLVQVYGLRLRRRHFFIGVIILSLLAIIALNFRQAAVFSKSEDLASITAISNPFDLPDLSLAETSIELSKMSRGIHSSYAGESVVSLILAPFPRSILPFKPQSGSAQFTAAFDPSRWKKTGSGLVIGGFNEIFYEMPFYGAFLIIAALGWVWASCYMWALRNRSVFGFVWTVGLYATLYTFSRADAQIVGTGVWSFGFYVIVAFAISRVVGRPTIILPRPRRMPVDPRGNQASPSVPPTKPALPRTASTSPFVT